MLRIAHPLPRQIKPDSDSYSPLPLIPASLPYRSFNTAQYPPFNNSGVRGANTPLLLGLLATRNALNATSLLSSSLLGFLPFSLLASFFNINLSSDSTASIKFFTLLYNFLEI